MEIFELSEYNPWWANPNSIKNDRELSILEKSSVQWKPGIKNHIKLDVKDYILYSIRGPRQVGKTTLIKILIKEKIEGRIDPQRIFFYTCNMTSGKKELKSAIETYINYARINIKERLYLFIDEITHVKEWQDAIKDLCESGKLDKTTVVVSGSHSMDLKAGAERLPGRRGREDITVHKRFVPMKFAEFIHCNDPELSKEFTKKGFNVGETRRKVLQNLVEEEEKTDIGWLLMHKKALDNNLNTYMITGGIPRAINEYMISNTIKNGTYSDYINAFISDISEKRDLNTAKLLMSDILKNIACKSHWNSLSSAGISQPSVKNYVEDMYDCFTVGYFYHLRTENKAGKGTKKGQKIYVLDPFIFHSMRYWSLPIADKNAFETTIDFLSDSSNRGNLVESIVADHLIRFAYNRNPNDFFDARNEIFFYEPRNTEIDFVLNMGKKLLPIESKYRNDIPYSSIKTVSSFAKNNNLRGIIVTKNDYEIKDNYILLPASIFLVLI